MSNQNKLLDFLVIGVARCGTTTLFHHLKSHFKIYIPAGKELPFFSDDTAYSRGWPAFVDEFFRDSGTDKLWGKVTPQYSEDPGVPERIYQMMPRVKLIALLRNPVDRAYSHYRFLVRRGVESSPFETAAFDPNSKKHHFYLHLGEYSRILKGYLHYFPPEQILVLFTEDLENNPERTLSKIQDFLKLQQPFRIRKPKQRYNVGGERTRFSGLISFAKSNRLLKRVWRTLPARVRIAIGKWYFFEVAPVREQAPSLTPEVRQRCVEYFRSDVMELERITGLTVPWSEFQAPELQKCV